MYNKQNSIINTVNSVLNQKYKYDFEIVIVDDGSTDDSIQELKKIDNPKVKIIKKTNGGESDARNIGILNSKYEYVAFLDADDVWTNDFLETIYSLKKLYSDAEVLCTKYIRKNKKIEIPPKHDLWKIKHGYINNYFKEINNTLGDMILTSSSTCIAKSAISKIGLFSYSDKLGADQDYWFRIFKNNIKAVYSNKVCAIYYLDGDNRACNNFKRFNNLNFIKRNYSKHNSLEENRYLANARIGAINDLFDGKQKTLATLTLIKEANLLIKATPKRLITSILKIIK
ncbi:glycosyltransferase family 2 protein [Moellerella wisconsensis]|nr:glycosyltransferase family 2 protein [Moellerella wisconsensis]